MIKNFKGPLLLAFLFMIVLIAPSCKKDSNEPQPQPPTTPTNKDTLTKTDTTPVPKKKWIVTTLAGSGVAGYSDGDSNQAKFNYPASVVADDTGNIYIADLNNNAIRMITQSGRVSTYLKSDFGPKGLVRDIQGNFFHIESCQIRKTTSSGSYVFAGSNQVSYKDGQGTDARFNITFHLAIDRQGNLYVPDWDMTNHFRIRKVTPSAYVSTMSLQDNSGYPSDLPIDAKLWYLYAIVADSIGNLYVTGNGGSLIKKIDPQGTVTLFAGTGSLGFKDGKGQAAQFFNITAITIDSAGNLWVCDSNNHAIRKVSPDGTVTTIAGNGSSGFTNGDSTTARFKFPGGIGIDKNGSVYVSDVGNAAIRKLVYQ